MEQVAGDSTARKFRADSSVQNAVGKSSDASAAAWFLASLLTSCNSSVVCCVRDGDDAH